MSAPGDLGAAPSSLDEPLRPAAIVGYLRALRAHWVLSAAIVVVAVASSLAWISQRSSTYVATSSLLVTPVAETQTSLSGLPLLRAAGGEPERPVRTAASMVQSRDVVVRAAAQLGGTPSADVIEEAIEVEAVTGQNLVEIEATSEDPATAARIANACARAALDLRQDTLRPLVAAAIEATERELAALPPESVIRLGELEARLGDLRAIDDGRDPALSLAALASAPTQPDQEPAWLILALAIAAGVGLAAAIAILIELLVPGRVNDEDELRAILTAPILARLPRMGTDARQAVFGETAPGAVEGFRALRSQLQFRRHGGEAASGANGGGGLSGVIAIASPSAADGRTYVAVGLARVVVVTRSQALLLEANVRRPSLAARLGIEPDRDLTPLLKSGVDLADVVTPVPSIPGLDVVVAPRVDNLRTAEQLSANLPQILERARAYADCVIVDTPQLGFASDAIPVLAVADELVMVVRLRHTRRVDLANAVDLLNQHDVEISGIVVVGSPHAEQGEPGGSRLSRRRARSAAVSGR